MLRVSADQTPKSGPRFPVIGELDMGAFADFFLKKHGADRAKEVARAIRESHRTVEKWFGAVPSAPSGWAMIKLVHVYGLDFLRAVIVPPPEWVEPAAAARDLQRAVAEVERHVGRLKAVGLLRSDSPRALAAHQPERAGPLGLPSPEALSGGQT